MTVCLLLFAVLALHEGFRADLVLEEGPERTSYRAAFTSGTIRVEPAGSEVVLLLEVGSKTLTLRRPEERVFTRLEPAGLKRLASGGSVSASWFPWVYRVSMDLVTDLSLREERGFRLPNGRAGIRVQAYSETYHRVVAEYWLDPDRPGDLFLQWRKLYFDFWPEEDADANRAQERRMEVYDRLAGFPVRMEERFALLSRSRTLQLEGRDSVPADAFSVPEDFTEKSPDQLLWEDLLRRLERWLLPKGVPGSRPR